MKSNIRRLGLLLAVLISAPGFAETWHADPISGCTVFDEEDAATGVLISWSGGCDETSRANGSGVLSWFEDGELAGRYEGEMSGGRANGHGVIYAISLQGGYDRIEGVFKDDEIDGYATAKTADGSTFEGLMNSKNDSASGILTNAAGDQYIGELLNGMLNGEGHLILASGEQFRGNFLNDELGDVGEWLGENGDYYKGSFAAGKFSGQGRYETATSEVYEGEFVDGLPEGEGRFTDADGRVTTGKFKAGWPDGQVDTVTSDGKATSELWVDGEKQEIVL